MGRLHTIEGRKNKQDAARAKIFTKHARAIAVAAREGGIDPTYNASLKTAIDKAKADNMPNDNIDRAIKKAADKSSAESYESYTYEGYGPDGIAVIVEALTDNKNRTAGNVRHYFDMNGGNLGTNGCVAFMFDRKGQLIIEKTDSLDADKLMEDVLDADIDDVVDEDDCFVVLTSPEDFSGVRDFLEGRGYTFVQAGIDMLPKTYTRLGSGKKQFERMLSMLEDDDDIQNVYHNAEADE